ncbi:MAG: AarF/ABC1/UbiB kinase family protein [Deltaproteobacteria bacterium]|nr:AarF/ABC1/UbiB kinase family protein [Deltaproteobacteria bacterium]MDQ3295785.1 AarF/UbiB family protein [Myxococcota bacterium]
MSAAIRLLRATHLFGVIFLSYLWQVSWARLWPARYDSRDRWKKINRRNARRMYKGFVRLRGVYIKLGQILSVMGTFLPREYTEELEALQDDVPPQRYKKIKATFVASFKKQPHEVFTTFNEEPIAAASLGQVHEATNAAGDRLAVKILYPNVATIIKVDLRVLGWALSVYSKFVPIQQISRVHEQLSDMLARETDLANEARCIMRMSKNFINDPDVLFPVVYPEWSSPTVMTMTFMDGCKITKRDALATMQLDPYDVATKLVKVFYKQLFIDRFFHADPHPGNFFVQRGPEGQVRIVVLDLGSATQLTDNLADGMFDILSGLMTRKDDLVVQGINTMGFMAPSGDRALLERTVRKYFEKLLNLNITDFGKIDPAVAQQLADPDMKRDELRELMKSIAYPEGWFYVERAAVIMFGLQSTLAPKLNGIHVGFPYITQFIMEKNAQRLADAAALAAKETAAQPAPTPPTDKPKSGTDEHEALLN